MITGDHKTTAQAIGRDIGLMDEKDIAVTGQELDAMSEEELDQKLDSISVYARVSPENKIRIVRAWQKKEAVTAMTGDGVNDAPALKQADIGIAMGTGTDVAKDSAAMILTDDNFVSIVNYGTLCATIRTRQNGERSDGKKRERDDAGKRAPSRKPESVSWVDAD